MGNFCKKATVRKVCAPFLTRLRSRGIVINPFILRTVSASGSLANEQKVLDLSLPQALHLSKSLVFKTNHSLKFNCGALFCNKFLKNNFTGKKKKWLQLWVKKITGVARKIQDAEEILLPFIWIVTGCEFFADHSFVLHVEPWGWFKGYNISLVESDAWQHPVVGYIRNTRRRLKIIF